MVSSSAESKGSLTNRPDGVYLDPNLQITLQFHKVSNNLY